MDTIFAPATARGAAGVAIVRVSGPAAGGACVRLAGRLPVARKAVLRRLREPVTADPVRRAFRPARLEADGRLVVPAWRGSGDLAHLADCTGIVEIGPATQDGLRDDRADNDDREHRYLDWRTP